MKLYYYKEYLTESEILERMFQMIRDSMISIETIKKGQLEELLVANCEED